MIHIFHIGIDLTPAEVKKRSRKYAMTGGYELALQSELTAEDLEQLVEMYLPIALEYDPADARFRSNNAYRILKLALEDGRLTQDTHKSLSSSLLLAE